MHPARSGPSRLSGLWFCLCGIGLFTLLLALLQPVYHWLEIFIDPTRCPNAEAAGNASPFGSTSLEVYLLLAGVSWLPLVLVEQVLPMTWRGRHPLAVLVRAAVAVVLSVAFVFYVLFGLVVVCG